MGEHRDLVVVTGGGSGIGEAVVKLLADSEFFPLVVDVNPPRQEALPHSAVAWNDAVDVSNPNTVAREVQAIENRHGPITGLVNAAGILGKMHRPEQIRLENWDREMSVDLRGTFLMCRDIGTRMATRHRGSIVNIASISGMSSAPVHAYAAAKAGVIQLTATLAAEWGRRGVRVNAVSPGFTRTPALVAGIEAGALNEDSMARGTAMGRLVEPIEVARAVVWLISSASSGVTGINIPVDAGFLAGVTWDSYGGFRGD